MLASHGLRRGDRVALLSRNRPEYIEIELAAANLGVITACLNWRLSPRELTYCVELVSPKLVIVEPDLAGNLPLAASKRQQTIEIGPQYERLLQQQADRAAPVVAEPEDGLVILYTSGTTGLPKGAVISHRAMIMRALVFTSELGISPSRQLRRLGADVSHGLDRSRPRHAAARRHGRDDRRLSGRTAAGGRRTSPDRLAGADPRHGRGVCRGAEGAGDQGREASASAARWPIWCRRMRSPR